MKAGWPGLGWGLSYPAKWYGKVDPLAGVSNGGTRLVRCTPAMSVSSVTQEFKKDPSNAPFIVDGMEGY